MYGIKMVQVMKFKKLFSQWNEIYTKERHALHAKYPVKKYNVVIIDDFDENKVIESAKLYIKEEFSNNKPTLQNNTCSNYGPISSLRHINR